MLDCLPCGTARGRTPGAICQNGRASLVTTQPNADVAPIHHRMPLALSFDEAAIWLHGDWPTLADRSALSLNAAPEHKEHHPAQLTLF